MNFTGLGNVPLIGPVLESISELITASGGAATVNPTGNLLSILIGNVLVSAGATVAPSGNAITLSVGTVFVPHFADGNMITINLGSVSVNAGGNISVGVTGNAIALSLGTATLVTQTNVSPIGLNIDIEVGQAVTPRNVTVNPTGLDIQFALGTAGVNEFVPLVLSFDPVTANLNGVISDLVVEDDYDLSRDIVGVPTDQSLVEAWVTVKENETDDDGEAILQKIITTISVSGVGQITDAGVNGTGHVVFQFTSAETNLLEAERAYFYDIQVRTNAGKTATREKGYLIPIGQVTDSL